MGKLYVLRHGNTFDQGDIVRRVGWRTDLPLSVSGIAQSQYVANGFVDADIRFTKIVCSPLLRTRQTAEAVAVAQQFSGDTVMMPFLREVDYGPDENQPEEQVVARVGPEAMELWDREAVVPDGWTVDVDVITQGWQSLLHEVAQSEGVLLAVTSNGVARFLLGLLDRSSVAGVSLKLGTCRYGVVDCKFDVARLEAWNVK